VNQYLFFLFSFSWWYAVESEGKKNIFSSYLLYLYIAMWKINKRMILDIRQRVQSNIMEMFLTNIIFWKYWWRLFQQFNSKEKVNRKLLSFYFCTIFLKILTKVNNKFIFIFLTDASSIQGQCARRFSLFLCLSY